MSDNVLILGAGASLDAGIPVLSQFFNRMIELSQTPYQFNAVDFKSVNKITKFLSSFHRGANFDDRNIEDVLSILYFLKISGDNVASGYFDDLVKCISNTIELCCTLLPTKGRSGITRKNSDYKNLWKSLFVADSRGFKLPSIITFNYDLVVERDLLDFFQNSGFINHPDYRLYFERMRYFSIDYSFGKGDKLYLQKDVQAGIIQDTTNSNLN